VAARSKKLVAAAVLVVACVAASAAAQQRRIVSLVPALTEMLFAIGAGPQVVGVGSFDKFPPEVETLPKVGALLDPDTERILSLRPTLVLTYGSQTDLHKQFERAGIKAYIYRHGGLDTIFQTLRDLGVEPDLVATSPIKIAFYVPRGDVERTVVALHEAFELSSIDAERAHD